MIGEKAFPKFFRLRAILGQTPNPTLKRAYSAACNISRSFNIYSPRKDVSCIKSTTKQLNKYCKCIKIVPD